MDNVNDEFLLAQKKLAKDIVGDIVLSETPEKVLRKWRNIFKVSQRALAGELGITSSVISDYESGRRKSPGIKMIKKYVISLLNVDTKSGGQITRSFSKSVDSPPLSEAIIDIKEFAGSTSINEICKMLNATLITGKEKINHVVYGYTIIDSLKAITELSFSELIKLYGITTQRVLIFTKVSTGKTPLVAIKLTNLHPALVVLHGLSVVDDVAKRIAEAESIPMAVCRMEKVDDIIGILKKID